MIRVGDTILNEDFIAAIRPAKFKDFFDQKDCFEGISVHLSNGAPILIKASMEDAQRELERVGFLDSQPAAMPMLLSDAEVTILEGILAQGFRYAAKDASGVTYCYTEPPTKGTASWLNDDEVSRVKRIIGGIDMLSFDDAYPLDIAVALGLEDE